MKIQQMLPAIAAVTVLGATLLGASGAAVAAYTGTIANTKHNLGAGPSTLTDRNHVADTGEICIFCHTPHGGDNDAPVPLWNKKLTDSVFITYDKLGTSTLDAAVAQVGSVSLACLTCHDGTQAIDNIINAPGSGGYKADGGGDTGLSWTWTERGGAEGGQLTAEGQFENSPDTGGTNIWMLGTDLTNDHPISMQYAGGGFSASKDGPSRDTDFTPASKVVDAPNRWYIDNPWVNVDGDSSMVRLTDDANLGTFDKWDFKLYTRNTDSTLDDDADSTPIDSQNGIAFAGEPEPFVECGSCHDPHLETTTFLRVPPVDADGMSNDGSRICLTCHTK